MSRKYTYVYVLQSVRDARRHYTGLTDDMRGRVGKHNRGECRHTAKHRPWRVKVAVAFRDRERAAAFENYLKSHSGRVFSARHF
ncbi:MAG: GIY-YIG nuclease family protein [Kiritimatiellae bacterium]|nr:GIY-YIG nuclease family protein [Kiritimatiellia bacterium]